MSGAPITEEKTESGSTVHELDELEKLLLDCLVNGIGDASPETVFILGAPRTGSTVLYQTLCSRLGLPYFSNLTNTYFPHTPIIGLLLQKALPVEISLTSHFGKTTGDLQPSEASAVMKNWFGGGHPSGLVSTGIVEGKLPHFKTTLSAAETLFGCPLLVKNPWNSFRVKCLAESLPSARFIWLRRDAAAAGKSDLSARYMTKGSPTAWNSATPANVEALQRLPPTAQVVENQNEYNLAIGNGLEDTCTGRWIGVWYDHFCIDPERTLERIREGLGLSPEVQSGPIKLSSTGDWKISAEEEAAIDAYVEDNTQRLQSSLAPKEIP